VAPYPPGAALGLTDTAWANRAGVWKETLSRLRRREACDFETLRSLAHAVERAWASSNAGAPTLHSTVISGACRFGRYEDGS